jgi:uncharacterized protein with PIN domain
VITIDTSAIIAILGEEAEACVFSAAIGAADRALFSAVGHSKPRWF